MKNDIKTQEVKETKITTETAFSKADIQAQLSNHGLDGLQFDYSSFPIISLKGSSFEMKEDPDFNPNGFDVIVIKTTEKHILTDINDNNYQEVKYSPDGITTTQGENISDVVAEMLEQGRNPQIKRYLDVMVQLKTNDKHNNKLAVLSISPTSVSRVSGFFYQLKLQGQLSNTSLQELKINVSKGQVRTSKGGHNYRLWQFELVQQEQLAA